jgi:hypothetical protein
VDKLEELEREIRELRKRRVGGEGDAALRDAEADIAMLVDELENMKGLLEENTYEMERLQEIVEECGGENGFGGASTARDACRSWKGIPKTYVPSWRSGTR